MSVQELWAEGQLDEAIELQTSAVKAQPTDQDRRYLLFGLLCFSGDLDRAWKQLDAFGTLDPAMQMGTHVYHNLLASEAQRRRVFDGIGEPMMPDDGAESVAQRSHALREALAGRPKAAADALESARSVERDLTGAINGIDFDAIVDSDELFGPVLEIYAGGRYLWHPLDRLRRLEAEPPRHLLDLLWIPAQLDDVDGTTADVHLPALYPGAHDAEARVHQLGRATEWFEEQGIARGVGQKVFLTTSSSQEQEHPVLDLRALRIGDVAKDTGAED